MGNNGVIINPAFLSGYEKLKAACNYLNSVQKQYGEQSKEFQVAFQNRQNAENIFCNTQGLISCNGSGLLTQQQAKSRINSYMNNVKSWYV